MLARTISNVGKSIGTKAIARPFTSADGPRAASDNDRLHDAVNDGTFPIRNIRNFCILAHVDHGKSTLADRILEYTTSGDTTGRHSTVLDTLDVEQQRGITVKSQTASFLYTPPAGAPPHLLNLIDTPGHVDFSYEVSRALAACSGALLLVDSTQGVQAQTLANYRKAREAGVEHFVPVLTKLDLPLSEPDAAAAQMTAAFGFDVEDIVLTSAKTGEGVDDVLDAVVARLPPPPGHSGAQDAEPRALVFDSIFDTYKGAVSLVAVVEGTLRTGDTLTAHHAGKALVAKECGVLAVGGKHHGRLATEALGPGQPVDIFAGIWRKNEVDPLCVWLVV